MLVIQKNRFLAFDSELKYSFPHFLDINDMLIMHPACYIFNETGLKAQLTAISQRIYDLVSNTPTDGCNANKSRFWVNSGGDAVMTMCPQRATMVQLKKIPMN